MKISIFYDHVKAIQKNESLDIQALVNDLKSHGVCGFDLSFSEIKNNAQYVADMLKEWGFCASSVYAVFDFSAGFEPSLINSLIADANTVGAKSVLVVPGNLPISNKEMALENMLRALSYACDEAEKHGIAVMVEDFDDLRSPTVSINGLAYFFDNEPRLKFNLDTGNFCCINDNIFDAISRFSSKIAHVHLKDRSLIVQDTVYITHCADGKIYYPALCGSGLMQIESVIQELHRNSYDGHLTLEYFGEPQSDKIFKSLDFIEKTIKKL